MATIYRFIIEQKTSGSGGRGGRKEGATAKKQTAKQGKAVSLLGGTKGGVEHNRKLRAINPLLNRNTNGYWEKGMRLGRAGLGLIKVNSSTGAFAGFSGTAIAIILAFVLQTVMRYQRKAIANAEKENTNNFKAMENSKTPIRGEYKVSSSLWSGALTYNQNK